MRNFEVPEDHLVLVMTGPSYSGVTSAATTLHGHLTGLGAGVGFVPQELSQSNSHNPIALVETALSYAENYSLTIVDGLNKKRDAALLLGVLGAKLRISHLTSSENTRRNRFILEAERNKTPILHSDLALFNSDEESDAYLVSDVYAMANTPPEALATDYLRPAEVAQKILTALRTPARV